MLNNYCVQGVDLGLAICLGIFIAFFSMILYWSYKVKHRREKDELISEINKLRKIINWDARNFLIGQKDFNKRLEYLKKCMDNYRIFERVVLTTPSTKGEGKLK